MKSAVMGIVIGTIFGTLSVATLGNLITGIIGGMLMCIGLYVSYKEKQAKRHTQPLMSEEQARVNWIKEGF